MAFYAQTTPWGILVNHKCAIFGIILQNIVLDNSTRRCLHEHIILKMEMLRLMVEPFGSVNT